MNGFEFDLENLAVNPDGMGENHRSLTREEMFVLAWFIFNQKSRTVSGLIADTQLTLEQCEATIRELIRLDLLRLP